MIHLRGRIEGVECRIARLFHLRKSCSSAVQNTLADLLAGVF